MKRCLCVLLVMLFLCACTPTDGRDSTAPTIDGDWHRTDGVCSYSLRLSESGDASCRCACGEHTNTSNSITSFVYDATAGTLSLYDKAHTLLQSGEVRYLDGTYLVVVSDGDTYVYENHAVHRPTVYDDALVGIDTQTAPCLTVLDYENQTLTVSAYNYDRDAAALFTVQTLPAADTVTFESVTVIVDNGVPTIDIVPLSTADADAIGTWYSYGYLFFDDNGNVEHIVFYGETIIEG